MTLATGDSTSYAERRRRAGRRLVIGFDGTEVTSELRELVREIRPGGFILFARNVVEPQQVRALNEELTSLLPADQPPLLSVDQEGGRVQRIREPATRWPSLREVGASGLVDRYARALAVEVRAMGFNLDFAPVADVDSNPENPVIGDRSFGPDPTTVAAHVTTFTRAMQQEGVLACAKHFPGHGDTDMDSHLDLPTIHCDEARLRRVELPPFEAAVRAGVASIMTAHVVFSAWDPKWPATLSPDLLTRLVRKELGFPGLLFTDDLEMKAVADRYSLRDQVERTLLGTVDVALACHQPDLQIALLREGIDAQERSATLAGCAADSERRLDTVVARLRSLPITPPLTVIGCDAHQELAEEIRASAAMRLG